MSNTVNMSLDEIIKQSKRTKRQGTGQRPGAVRGRGRGRGRGGRGGTLKGTRGGGVSATRGIKRGRARGRGGAQARLSRIDTLSNRNAQNGTGRSRSQSRGRSLSRQRSRSQNRSASRQRSLSRGRQRSQSGNRFQQQQTRQRSRSRSRTGRGRGAGTVRGRANLRTRGISLRGLRARNMLSGGTLRSDQIAKVQKMIHVQQKVDRARLNELNEYVQTQTFTRSKSPARTLTVRVPNRGTPQKRRPLNRRGIGKVGYLDVASLARLTAALGGAAPRRGPGSVRSMNSNRSRRSTRSNRSLRGAVRGRGRGARPLSRQGLNPLLQMEIAAIQGKTDNRVSTTSTNQGVNFTPVPHLTTTTLSQRFGSL